MVYALTLSDLGLNGPGGDAIVGYWSHGHDVPMKVPVQAKMRSLGIDPDLYDWKKGGSSAISKEWWSFDGRVVTRHEAPAEGRLPISIIDPLEKEED